METAAQHSAAQHSKRSTSIVQHSAPASVRLPSAQGSSARTALASHCCTGGWVGGRAGGHGCRDGRGFGQGAPVRHFVAC